MTTGESIAAYINLQTADASLRQCRGYVWLYPISSDPKIVDFTFEDWIDDIPVVQCTFERFLFTTSRGKLIQMFDLSNLLQKKENNSLVLKGKTVLESKDNNILSCSVVYSLWKFDNSFEGQICVIKSTMLFLLNFFSSGLMVINKIVQMPDLGLSSMIPPSSVFYVGSQLVVFFTWPNPLIVTLEKLNNLVTKKILKQETFQDSMKTTHLICLGPEDLFFIDGKSLELIKLELESADDFAVN